MVGLDQMAQRGFTIMRSIRSQSWPAHSANLAFAAVWGTRGPVADLARRVSDGLPVRAISTLLEPGGSVHGVPKALTENRRQSFVGCYALGQGFLVEEGEARAWIESEPRNSDVLFPYLNGEDLNSRPTCSATRWAIDFNDRSEDSAREYALPFSRLVATVKPERQRRRPNGTYQLRQPLPTRWWQYADKRPAMRAAIAPLGETLVIAQVSRTLMPVRVSTRQVLSNMLVVFATDSYGQQATLSSSLHQLWAMRYGSGMRNDPRYTPSDVFETFPRPVGSPELDATGRELDHVRREIMLRRDLGLTQLYNLVNDPELPSSADLDVARLREIHVEIDEAVMAAYGWSDVPLNHGFHTYRQMTRWTVCPEARVEILDRLLEENHRRAALQGEAAPAASNDDEGDDE